MKKRILDISVLPGQPLDGTGKLCIHLFVPDSRGPFTEPCVMQLDKVKQMRGEVALFNGPKQGRLACDPKRLVAPVTKNNITKITLRTGDPRAATCPKCIASPDYKAMIKVLTDAQQGVPDEPTIEQEIE